MELNDFSKLESILKTARKSKGITEEQLAVTMKILPRYLMSIEKEKRNHVTMFN